jgi:hypothetical protein
MLALFIGCQGNDPEPGEQGPLVQDDGYGPTPDSDKDLGPVEQGSPYHWKSFSQLEIDLDIITAAGYSRVCLFDLKAIRDYPDPRYIPLVKQYADRSLEITVYVQDVEVSQSTVELLSKIGGSAVIVHEEKLSDLFHTADIPIFWWSGTAFPDNHRERPQYLGWTDLRGEQVRQDIADWAVQIPRKVDGGLSLDYIRWNKVGAGRNAEQVTDLVQRIRVNWDRVGNGTLSAAVYPYLGQSTRDGGALSVGQKWDEWLENDLLDFVYPMAYDSKDIPWLIVEWKSYDQHRIVPCLSAIDFNP